MTTHSHDGRTGPGTGAAESSGAASGRPDSVAPTYAGQNLVWTALPQGYFNSDTVQIGVFMAPMLSYYNPFTKATSQELAAWPYFVNWPQSILDNGLTFSVQINGVDIDPNHVTQPDLSVLNPDYWAAAFDPDATIVKSFVGENFSAVVPTTFNIAEELHSYILQTIYGANGAAISAGSKSPTGPTEAKVTVIGIGPNGTIEMGPSSAFAATTIGALQEGRPAAFGEALFYHSPLTSTAPVIPPVPVLDFHQALSAIAHTPEVLPYLGLTFTLRVVLPDDVSGDFALAVIPNFSPELTNVQHVPVAVNCTLGSTPDQIHAFFATPTGNDYTVTPTQAPSGGFLDLGVVPVPPQLPEEQFMIIDYSVDGAVESLNTYTHHLQTLASANAATPGFTISTTLPAMRSASPTLIWNNWGGPITDVSTGGGLGWYNMITLAARQADLQASISAYAANPVPAELPPAVYLEDVIRGWRMDVANVQNLTGADTNFTWQSLHWQLGTYSFGPAGSEITLSATEPVEGMVVPSMTIPASDSNDTSTLIHEGVARWDGWGLAVPRPFSLVDQSGNLTSATPNGPSSATDGNGHLTPQFSAQFAIVRAGVAVGNSGYTGLPTLRFGVPYRYRMRAVDLTGWSLPQLTASTAAISPPLFHTRWEPIQSPVVVPSAPFGVGEGALTIVLRDDGVTAASPNARWLFPPKVHEQMAEEHGAFDTAGLPDPSKYELIGQYADGSVASLPGSVQLSNSAGGYAYVPAPTQPPQTRASWLPDPTASGISVTVWPNGQTTVADAPFMEAWANPWPALHGKLLQVVPTTSSLPLPGQPGYEGIQAIAPGWDVTPAGDGTSEVLTLSVVPGSVYQVDLCSLPGPDDLDVFGLTAWIAASPGAPTNLNELFMTGQIPQLTPTISLRTVYATLLPAVGPAFSDQVALSRLPNDTTVGIADTNYVVDPATTSTVTWNATWTDPLDTTFNADPDSATVDMTQGALVAAVEIELASEAYYPYVPAVPDDPLVASVPPSDLPPPFGSIELVDQPNFQHPLMDLGATHHVGDTKHHYVTYVATATSRFSQFFAETTRVTFARVIQKAGSPPAPSPAVTLNKDGIDANHITVVLPATATASALTIASSLYDVDGQTGQIWLVADSSSVLQDNVKVPLAGTPLEVTWVPTDTLVGTPASLHVLNTAVPAALPVVKVAPAWRVTENGTVLKSTYVQTRTGNMLRVYIERPWFITGVDEVVGVIAAPGASGPTLPIEDGFSDFTIVGFDPISVSSHERQGSYSQAVQSFVGASGPDILTLGDDGPTLAVWSYKPAYDSVTDLWFVDIELDFEDALPPGYFVRLALARYQPYSIATVLTGGAYSLSPVSLVTYAQPVPDRAVSVVQVAAHSVGVTVSGPGYYGWRPQATGTSFTTTQTRVNDVDNRYATHPNSDDPANPGSRQTSTMIVEVQAYDESSDMTGDFAWNVVDGYSKRLNPSFPPLSGGGNDPIIEWSLEVLELPTNGETIRLRITELDYYPYLDEGMPSEINTSQRRPWVAYIPLKPTESSR